MIIIRVFLFSARRVQTATVPLFTRSFSAPLRKREAMRRWRRALPPQRSATPRIRAIFFHGTTEVTGTTTRPRIVRRCYPPLVLKAAAPKNTLTPNSHESFGLTCGLTFRVKPRCFTKKKAVRLSSNCLIFCDPPGTG